MKNLLFLILTFSMFYGHSFGNSDNSGNPFEQVYGIGKVVVKFESNLYNDKPYILNLYRSNSEDALAKTVEIKWNDNNGGYVETKNIEFIKVKDFYLEEPHYILMFNCLKEINGFYEVIINVDTKETMWLKKQSTIQLKLWDDFLKSVICLSSLDAQTNQIRVKPNDNSEVAMENVKDECFEVIEVKGDWLNIRCFVIDFDMLDEKYRDFNGWLKWRDENELLIEYYLSY